MASSAYETLRGRLRETGHLASVLALVQWDQETYMPAKGGPARSEQCALLSGLVHERKTAREIGELLAACERDPALTGDEVEAANLREMRRDYALATKLPTELVSELARVGSLAQDAWKHARAASDFGAFKEWLERMVELVRRKAGYLRGGGGGGGGEVYDALLDEYEPGCTAKELDGVFGPLRGRLAGLVKRVGGSAHVPDAGVVCVKTPTDAQQRFGVAVLKGLGFDFEAGRLDVTTHPFCSGLAAGDTRLTTRYTGESFLEALFGSMHEAGHGMYEQGLPKGERTGEPLGEAVSLGVHESQSRLWENFVGRSRPFWKWAIGMAKHELGRGVEHLDAETVYRACNVVRPSYIRVEADEATYNLHIMVRFGIERALVNGTMGVDEVPAAWNEAFERLVGLKVPDDRRGCLQDVHWSFGLVGYFPTYTLGNLYAAQLWEAAHEQVEGLERGMEAGDFSGLKRWLNEGVHRHGRRYRAEELCRRVTGKALSAEPLLRHLEGKLGAIYGV